jgi:hypothetical protein
MTLEEKRSSQRDINNTQKHWGGISQPLCGG